MFLGLVALASAFSQIEPNADDVINHINSLGTTWKAGHNFPKDMPQSQKKRMMSGLLPTPENKKKARRPLIVPEGWEAPESFDAREQWPDCPTIPKIQDQGDCGSCWAVAAVTVMSDRSCIASNGTENFQYSIENLLACSDGYFVGDCDGGYIDEAFNYWVGSGIVSGGPYNSEEGCQPYTILPTGYAAAGLVNEDTPPCLDTCRDGYEVAYADDIRFGAEHQYIANDVAEIQYEIMTNGPVEVGFDVYLDFEYYESGVYQHEMDLYMGGHAVRMLGWGVEDGTPYWLCANSWNTSWGETGYFKIIRGINDCGIEGDVNAGTPKPL